MHMIAATTTDALSVVDTAVLKKAPSSIPSCLDLVEETTASSWSPDNNFLYISSSHTIHRYDPTSNNLKSVYVHEAGFISHIIAKGNNTTIFSSEDVIHVLECDQEPEPRISQTYTSHKSPINSLSLSNDYTLLASTSSSVIHVHNLVSGTHTAMRGSLNQNINACVFHPHSRTRLLVGAGKQLLVYDVTRPSGPLKTVVLNDTTAGDISAIACSPFSKTLVVIACSNGLVGLVDLEKDKALFRILNLKNTLTAVEFSSEGASIYLGTDAGKIMIVDLRALDKPPKVVSMSTLGSRIQTISVQKKFKSSTDTVVKTPAGHPVQARKTPSENLPSTRRPTASTMPQGPRSASKTAPSPARTRAAIAASPTARRMPSSMKDGPVGTPVRRPLGKDAKQVLSPVRDPLGNSASKQNIAGQLDEQVERRGGKSRQIDNEVKPAVDSACVRHSPSLKKNVTISSGRVSSRTSEAENPRRARTLPSSSSTSVVPTRRSNADIIVTSLSAGEHLSAPRTSPPRRHRTMSTTSRTVSEATSVLSVNTRTTTATVTSRPSSSASRPGSSLTSATTQQSSSPREFGLKSAASLRDTSRTPSPDFPELRVDDPVTPIPVSKQQKKLGMGVLGMGTPEVNRWIQAGKAEAKVRMTSKGKTVGFEDDQDNLDDDDNDDELLQERERNLSLQISPQRPIGSSSISGNTQSWAASPNIPSDLSPGNAGNGGSTAQDLLKTIVQDVMFDFQRESKAEMMGLHLDLLRMGRSWKAELRQLMDEYVGDLRDLREENQRLRQENERLRRGF